MAERLLQSTAFRVAFRLALTSDHLTAATGKTVAVTISKNGAAFGNPSGGATNATEIGNGWYYVDLSTTDTGTLGPLVVRGTATASDPAETAYTVANGERLAASQPNSLTFTGTVSLTPTAGTPLTIAAANDGADTILITNPGNGADTIAITNAGGNGSFVLNAHNTDGQALNLSNDGGAITVQIDNDGSATIPVVITNCTVSANLGTTQPVNFTGTGASAKAQTDVQSVATNAVSAAAVSAAAGAKIADITKRRTQANTQASSDGDALSTHSIYGFVQQGQRSSVSGVTQTVKNADGTTLGTFTLTVAAAAEPITGVS